MEYFKQKQLHQFFFDTAENMVGPPGIEPGTY